MKKLTLKEIQELPNGAEIWLEEFNFWKAEYHKQRVTKIDNNDYRLSVFSPEEDAVLDFKFSGYKTVWIIYID